MQAQHGILFTAFEPSGDEHAAPIIRHIKSMRPELPIYALGGPKMETAGAELIENTVENAAMGLDALAQARTHLARRDRMAIWMKDHPIGVHVPTDSPAANWAYCKLIRKIWSGDPKVNAKVVHMVAPQVWAWASWRVKRLQKWSDLVLCILPFEGEWFKTKNVKTKFIGHPLFDESLDIEQFKKDAEQYPDAPIKMCILPGSRNAEIRRNWPVMLDTWAKLREKHPEMIGLIAIAEQRTADKLLEINPNIPEGMQLIVGESESIMHWADVVFAVSGTVTLHATRHLKPMTVLYKAPRWLWYTTGWWIMTTRNFALPNLITNGMRGKQIVKEFIPFWGSVKPIVDELDNLITDESKREQQVKDLQAVLEQFKGHDPGKEAAETVLEMYDGR